MKFHKCDNCSSEIFYVSDMIEFEEYKFCNKYCKNEFIESVMNCDDIDKIEEFDGTGFIENETKYL